MIETPAVQNEAEASASSAIAIRADRVVKKFGTKEVLKSIQLDIEAGQFVAIVGKSGSGKSTLLRIVAGLDSPTEGRLLFNESPQQNFTSKVTMMYQDSRLLDWKKVIDNVGIGLKGDWKAKAERVLDAVGLLAYKDEWPSTLSGGQKQRVALARALVREPSLLLLDEPLSALDALTRLEMQNLIENIWTKLGFTALLVTHDVREAVRLADRIILIEDGYITMDILNNEKRPRDFSDVVLAAMEKQVVDHIMGVSAGNIV